MKAIEHIALQGTTVSLSSEPEKYESLKKDVITDVETLSSIVVNNNTKFAIEYYLGGIGSSWRWPRELIAHRLHTRAFGASARHWSVTILTKSGRS